MIGLMALLTYPNHVTMLMTLPGMSQSSHRARIVCTTKNGVQQNRKAPGKKSTEYVSSAPTTSWDHDVLKGRRDEFPVKWLN